MIRRLFIWSLWLLVGLVLLAVGAVAFILRTEMGHSYVLGYALPRVEASTGIKVEYARVAGAWPDQIVFNGLVLSDDKGVWLTAEKFALDWNALAVLTDRIDIRIAHAENGVFYREPVIRGAETRTTKSTGTTPHIEIRNLRLKRFGIGKELFDQELLLDLDGGFSLSDGRRLKARVDADVDTPQDFGAFLHKLLGEGFKLQGTVDGDLRDLFTIGKLRLTTRDGRLTITGNGNYHRQSRAITADLTGRADPTLASVISSDFSTTRPFSLKAQLSGPFNELAIKAEATFVDATYAAYEIPPFNAAVDFVRTRPQVTGPFTVRFTEPDSAEPAGTAAGLLTYETAGRLKIANLDIGYHGARLKGSLDLELDSEPVSGDIWFNADIPELSSLPISSDLKGMLRASGRVHLANSVAIEAQAESDHLVVSGVELKTLAATASGTLDALSVQASFAALSYPAAGTMRDGTIAGVVGVKDEVTSLRLDRLTAQLGGELLKLQAPTKLTSGTNRLTLDQTNIAWGDEGRFSVSASRAGENLKIALKVTNFEPPQVPALITGTIDVDTARATPGTIGLKFVPTSTAKAKVTMDLAGKWDGKRLALGAAFQGFGEDSNIKRIQPLTMSLPLALTTGKGISVSLDGPVDGRLVYNGSIEPFASLAPLPEQTLTGQAAMNMRMSGTLDDPVFGGTLSLKDGTYEHTGAGVLIDRLNFDGRAERSSSGYVLSVNVTASDGMTHTGGAIPLRARGVMTLGKKSPVIDASVTLDRNRIVNSTRLTGIASGTIDLDGTLPDLVAKGALAFHTLDINIPESVGESGYVEVKVVAVDARGRPIETEALPADEKTPINVALDVTISAPENVNIRGRGLNSEWSANLKLAGTDAEPTLDGPLSLRKGRFDFSNRRFELTQGTVGFVPSHTTDPDLGIEARYTSPEDIVAIIRVVGRASSPKITLSSDPPQAEEDVMSTILFGKPARELSAFEAVQTANALARLTGTGLIPGMGGPGILDRARATLGLDLLNVSLGETGGVSVGKYVQENIYVSAKQGLAGEQGSVSVNVDVNKWLSVKTDVGQDSSSSVGVFWKRDY